MYSLMNTKLHHHHLSPLLCSPIPLSLPSIPRTCLSPFKLSLPRNALSTSTASLYSPKPRTFSRVFSKAVPFSWGHEKDEIFDNGSTQQHDDLDPDSPVYQNTLRLVECSMFAAVSGLTYLLSNSLAIENYFGCFFALPIVISSMRWGIPAGRKTMVATAVLLLVLSGPVKALTYVLMHGLLGLTMGSLWRMQVKWRLSVFLCTLVRALGAVGYVLTSSFLIRENILSLITINVHATITLIFNSLGFYTVPSMNTIYAIFCILLLVNCSFFVFLLHILYALFLTRLGMKASLKLPRWLQNAL